jgi:DNA-binding transcriptional regulator YiaG
MIQESNNYIFNPDKVVKKISNKERRAQMRQRTGSRGDKVRRFRKMFGLKLSELGLLLNKKPKTIEKWEDYNRGVPVGYAIMLDKLSKGKMAVFTEVPPIMLLPKDEQSDILRRWNIMKTIRNHRGNYLYPCIVRNGL